MADTTPLLDDIDDNCPHNGEFEGETYVPATTYPKYLVKILIVITIILSTFTIALLIISYIIILRALAQYSWTVREASLGLGTVVRVFPNSFIPGLHVPTDGRLTHLLYHQCRRQSSYPTQSHR